MPPARGSNSSNLFSLVVIKRILDILSGSGEIKKTNLAGKAGLNYPNCVRYLELLKVLGWVRISDDGSNYIHLTQQGIHFRSVLPSIEGKASDDVIGSFTLQESDEPKDAAKEAGEIRSAQNEGKPACNILLVDDEPDVLLTYKIFLTKQGYNVKAFPDAKSALEEIKSSGSSYYDLVITDIRMKSLNGLQLYQKIKSVDPKLKIIFVSALDAVEELVSIFPDITGRDIIKKPVNEQEFVERIKDVLSRAHVESRVVPPARK